MFARNSLPPGRTKRKRLILTIMANLELIVILQNLGQLKRFIKLGKKRIPIDLALDDA